MKAIKCSVCGRITTDDYIDERCRECAESNTKPPKINDRSKERLSSCMHKYVYHENFDMHVCRLCGLVRTEGEKNE